MPHKAIAPVLLLAGPLFCLQTASLQTARLAVETEARDLWHVRPDRPEYCQELASRLAALPGARTTPAKELGDEGLTLCRKGYPRTGVAKLRRAIREAQGN
ncbi:hypothetical protein MVG78_16125 [Roseomonas gilardii subsp. gilardii]|uniref:hypothetical protein n=1 Tax=Roseomonas gilardii TaxID=257708 RepID=UPI001FFA55BD|nr:hypothetical protein [Roseomonas gilardii]UPG72039.1 hypothetical protein MVG78_16125 [Roseomonas gilardii subsp. gilardii]